MSEQTIKRTRQIRRKRRTSFKIIGTDVRPRISVYRSNEHMFVQVIDDTKHATLASATDVNKGDRKGTKTERAKSIGVELAEKLKKLNIKSAVFDRGSYRYLGRVSALATSIRESGVTI